MIYPSPDKLDSVESKYALVIVAAKRARQIKEGARRLVDSKTGNPLTVALEEIAAGEIIPVQVGEPEKLPTSVAPSAVLSGLVATSFEEDEPTREHTVEELGALLSSGDIMDSGILRDDDSELADEEPPYGTGDDDDTEAAGSEGGGLEHDEE